MKTEPLSRQEKDVIAAHPGIASVLEKLDSGRPRTPRSWLYEAVPIQTVLDDWTTILEESLTRCDVGERVYQFDLEQVKKFGPQGEVPPIEDILEDIAGPTFAPSPFDGPYQSENEILTATEISECKLLAQFLLGPNRQLKSLRPKSFDAVVDDMRERDTLNTWAGWPLGGSRNDPATIQQSIEFARSGEAWDFPAVLLVRSYNGKLRMVWMYPMSMNLIEGSYTQVIQEVIRETFKATPDSKLGDYTAPWEGFTDVKRQFTSDWSKYPYAAGGDTTKMDAHMRKYQMLIVWTILRYMFQERYWDELRRVLEHVCDIPILVSSHSKLTGNHGVASGSGWTQLSETIYQIWMAWMNGKVRAGMGIGDDFVWFDDYEPWQADYLVDWLDDFGLPANPDKQSVHESECTFLQRLFLKGYYSREDEKVLGGIYPTIRALNSMVNPEHFHNPKNWNSDMFCVKIYQILENTVDHPSFEQFCDYVVKGQKDLIPFAHKSDAEISSITQRARLIPNLTPSYNQEKRDKSLSDFMSIKYVREHYPAK